MKHSLYPYMPHHDRNLDEKFDEDDLLFSYMTMAKPGRSHVFLYCKLNEKDELKAHISSDIPIRS